MQFMLDICLCNNYEIHGGIVFNGTKSQFKCFGSEWDKETAELPQGTGMLQRVRELELSVTYFGAGKHIKIVINENRRKYYGWLCT